jgi:hypothetical protein
MTVANGYVTASDVRKFFLGAPLDSLYSESDIEAMIDRQGLEVERLSGNAWRAVTCTEEYHTITPNVNNGPYYNIYTFQLKHHGIRSITKLEIFDGSSWIDYVATKTEGREKDYWVDYVNGIVYINGYRYIWHGFDARTTYVYGKTTVDSDARELNLRYVAREIMGVADYTVSIPDSGAGRKKDRYDRNEERIRELEARLANNFQLINEGDWI